MTPWPSGSRRLPAKQLFTGSNPVGVSLMSHNLHTLKAWFQDKKLPDVQIEIRQHKVIEKLSQNADTKENQQILESLINMTGPDQIIVTGPHGQISIIHGECSMNLYEIYSLSGDLFDGIRRYKTIKDVGNTVISLITTGLFDESIRRSFDIWTDVLSSTPDGTTQEVDMNDFFDQDED